ncbi:MAG: VWA domain-containing protein [Solobacterium sp.]|nr:VWA domain-containing protein [Solobacterium sp.]
MGNNYQLSYIVDLVFVIDATGSMRPILNTVKNNALNLYGDFMNMMNRKNKSVQSVRVRLIAFRDYYFDKEDAMLVTDFFILPQQAKEFKACVESIEAKGGGDDPEDGLEALAYAMKSDWNRSPGRKRHVIVLWSDDGTHELGFGSRVPNYPQGMARNFNELTAWWGSRTRPGFMDESAKRLLLFTPAKRHYTDICSSWNNVIMYESAAGRGMSDVDYQQILNAIANSI